MKLIVLVSMGTLLLSVTLSAENDMEEFLHAFHQNPKEMMDQLPSMVTAEGITIPRGSIQEDRVEKRIELRERDNPSSDPSIFASPDHKNLAENIVDVVPPLKNIRQMESQGLTKSSVRVKPWTDSYWPFYSGMTGNRYADTAFPNTEDWQENRSYIDSNSAASIASSGNSELIDLLSPAEKYDLAMGDEEFTLSGFAWAQGQKMHSAYGRVARWMGICHGWAAAAHMNAPFPESAITVLGASGVPITFHPQDIKALQSMLWANASGPARFAGSRCNVHNPQKNSNGRILSPNCFDVNPGTWHQALISQIGVHKRSLIMDSTFDVEVWNYPISAFEYRYFNPQSLKSGSLKASAIPIKSFKIDKFREFRSKEVKFVLGISMNVTFVIEIKPMRALVAEPPTKTIRLVYDLELDEKFNILGGEWYTNAHPDFLWTYAIGSQAEAREDIKLVGEVWTLEAPVPARWSELARSAASKGRPLFSFIRRLTGQ